MKSIIVAHFYRINFLKKEDKLLILQSSKKKRRGSIVRTVLYN